MLSHDLLIAAEASLQDPVTYLMSAGMGLAVFLATHIFKSRMSREDITRDEITKIQVQLGIIDEKIKACQKDIDGVGAKVREK